MDSKRKSDILAESNGEDSGRKKARLEHEKVPDGRKDTKNAASVLEKAKKALEMQKKLKERLQNLKKDESEKVVRPSDSEVAPSKPSTSGKQLELVEPDLPSQDVFYDPAIGGREMKRMQRRSRPALQFVEHGTFKKQAEEARLVAEYGEEYVKRMDQEVQMKEGSGYVGVGANAVPIGGQEEVEAEQIPAVEWWDSKILVNKETYPEGNSWESMDISGIKTDRITHYIEHPVELDPPFHQAPPVPAPLKLTRREMKKLRTQRRQAREAEKQDLIRQGLLEPPKPKVKISNLMRVLGSESTADPTAIEMEVSRQMAERAAAHEDRNLARMLTPAERREKKMRKLLDHPPGDYSGLDEVKVAVYKVKDLSKPQNRFKIQANARENHLSGVLLIVPGVFSLVIVEGGPKTLRRYQKLMLQRIKWNESADEDMDLESSDTNYCDLVWTGVVAEKAFKGKFKTEEVYSEHAARKHLTDRGVAHYWDLAAAHVKD